MFRTELCKVDIRDSDLVNIQEAVDQMGKWKWKSIVEIPIRFDFIEKVKTKDLDSWEKYIKINGKGHVDICYEFFEGDEGILDGEDLLELPELWVSDAALDKIDKIGFDNINLKNREARKLKKYVMLKRMGND